MPISSVIAWIQETTVNLIAGFGLWSVFLLMTLESASIPFPSFITMPFAGFMAAKGYWGIWSAVLVGTAGNMFGSILAYWLGIKKGEAWVRAFIRKFGKYFLLTEEKFDSGKNLFSKYGKKIVFFTRMIPIVRAFTSLPAGVSQVNFRDFIILSTIGSFIYVILLTYLGFFLGESWLLLAPIFKKLQILIVILIFTGIVLYLLKSFKKRKPKKL